MSDDPGTPKKGTSSQRLEQADLRLQLEILKEEKAELRAANELLEEQNAVLGNLAVAFQRLYSSTEYVQVVGIVKEILANLIGSTEFSIYVVDAKKDKPVLITREGKEPSTGAERELIIAQTMGTGELFIADEKALREKKKPVACIPLKLRGKTVGTIVLDGLLVQKQSFQKQDREIFELLGNHASMALYFRKLSWIVAKEVKLKLREAVEDLTPPTAASLRSIVSGLVEARTSKRPPR
jgi:hypothetical protein